MAKIEWNIPKKKKRKATYDWYTSGISRLLKASRGTVEASLDKEFGVPAVNPRKKTGRVNNNDVFK